MELVAKANVPVARTVHDVVVNADLILDIGGVLWTELNTGMRSDDIDVRAKAICLHDNWTRVGEVVYMNVALGDVIDA